MSFRTWIRTANAARSRGRLTIFAWPIDSGREVDAFLRGIARPDERFRQPDGITVV